MSINPVSAVLQAAFNLEIANPFTVHDNTITVTLPHGDTVVITVFPLTPITHTIPPHRPTEHTYHYEHQHDFTATPDQPLARLILHNLEDCRSYLDDVCHTFINAEVRDFELTFPDGAVYLITVDPAQ